MTLNESDIFIEEMETIGDVWTQDLVMRVYGDKSLQAALKDRRSSISELWNLIENVLKK